MFNAMTRTYKIGKLVEGVIDKINKSNDFDVELNMADDNTITVTIKKLGIEESPVDINTVIVRR